MDDFRLNEHTFGQAESFSARSGRHPGSRDPFGWFARHCHGSELDLSGLELGPVKAWEISTNLFASMNLVRLNLGSCRVGNSGGEAVARGLVENFTLKDLDMSDNALGRAAMSAFGELVQENDTLERLDVSRNCLTDDAVVPLVAQLRGRAKLRELVLSHNLLCDSFAETMALSLEDNVYLQRLLLRSNLLEATGLAALLPGLEKTVSLKVLDISWNNLRDSGAEKLAAVLKANKSLVEISACGNLFTKQAAEILAPSLRFNDSVETLRLGHNLMRNAGAHRILGEISRLVNVSKLRVLDISGTLVDQAFQERVNKELAMPNLKILNFSVMVPTPEAEKNTGEVKTAKAKKVKKGRKRFDNLSDWYNVPRREGWYHRERLDIPLLPGGGGGGGEWGGELGFLRPIHHPHPHIKHPEIRLPVLASPFLLFRSRTPGRTVNLSCLTSIQPHLTWKIVLEHRGELWTCRACI